MGSCMIATSLILRIHEEASAWPVARDHVQGRGSESIGLHALRIVHRDEGVHEEEDTCLE